MLFRKVSADEFVKQNFSVVFDFSPNVPTGDNNIAIATTAVVIAIHARMSVMVSSMASLDRL